MSMWKEFKAFLIKENVLALAIAVVVGLALNKLVTALVDDFIMPIVAAATPDPKTWQSVVTPGPIPFKIGDFGSAPELPDHWLRGVADQQGVHPSRALGRARDQAVSPLPDDRRRRSDAVPTLHERSLSCGPPGWCSPPNDHDR